MERDLIKQQLYDFINPPFEDKRFWIYDLETFPNCFTATFFNPVSKNVHVFEISDRKNDVEDFTLFIAKSNYYNCTHVGFNNQFFDYPIIDYIFRELGVEATAPSIYKFSQMIINAPWGSRWDFVRFQPLVTQIDLMMVAGFGTDIESTSLKMLECRMNLESVEDLEFDFGIEVNSEQIDLIVKYNVYDVWATYLFFREIEAEVMLRFDMGEQYGLDLLNSSDQKMGAKIFESILNKEKVPCNKHLQTIREKIALKDCILDYITLESSAFMGVKQQFESSIITETKGVFDDMSCLYEGLTYVFGLGGLHASVRNKAFHARKGRTIMDSDVKSFYPNLAIKNTLYPEHLSPMFCKVYDSVYQERASYPKHDARNKALKRALTATYGNSNSKHSSFFDSQFAMTITISGQLTLCMLVEKLVEVGAEIISVNTDGVLYIFDNHLDDKIKQVCDAWERSTNGLILEHQEYQSVYQRDVNNYLAINLSGEQKRKGCYAYGADLTWEKDHGKQVVAKSACEYLACLDQEKELALVYESLTDIIIHVKVPRNVSLYLGDKKMSQIIRVIVSEDGDYLKKISQPTGAMGAFKRASGVTKEDYQKAMIESDGAWVEGICTKNRSVYKMRESAIVAGYKVKLVDNLKDIGSININETYYANEVHKLVSEFN